MSHARSARRQAFLERFADAVAPLVAPRLSVEAHGGKGLAVLLDGGGGGTTFARAAPWLPRWRVAADLVQTARGAAEAVHAAATCTWPGTTGIGTRTPAVSGSRGRVTVRFYGARGEPLPAVHVPLRPQDEQVR